MLDAAEEARLAALASYCVLDTESEDEYDDLTRLAAHGPTSAEPRWRW